jgi:hypothetical protein
MTEKDRINRWANLKVDTKSGTVTRVMGRFLKSPSGRLQLASVERLPMRTDSKLRDKPAYGKK